MRDRVRSFWLDSHQTGEVQADVDGQMVPYERDYFSAVSTAGHLLAARYRKTVHGEPTGGRAPYAVLAGSLHDDSRKGWMAIEVVKDDDDIERGYVPQREDTGLVLDWAPDVLQVEPEWAGHTDHDRALREIYEQAVTQERVENSTRILLGQQAWKLYEPGERVRRLRDLSDLIRTMKRAQDNGLVQELPGFEEIKV